MIEVALTLLGTLVPTAFAQTMVHQKSVPDIISGLVNVLFYMSAFVTLSVFLLGGFYMVASGGNEQVLGNGKKLMRFSLIGFAIILGSWMLLSTFVNFFLAPLG